MDGEREKIARYFTEAARVWTVNPSLVGTRQFYEMWEDACDPRPWLVHESSLTLGDLEFELYGEGERVAWIAWSDEEQAPVLTVEGEDVDQFFLLGVSDAYPAAYELPPVARDEEELSFGERLEVVYDVIAWMRSHRPERNVLDLRLGDFREAIDEVSERHDPRVVRLMKKLHFPFMQKLLEKAAEDMPEDELGPQLTLAFGDSYASPGAPPSVEDDVLAGEGAKPGLCRPSRTQHRVAMDLEFLEAICTRMAENERVFAIPFDQAQVLEESDDGLEVGVSVEIDDTLRIDEGACYQVFAADREFPLGQFTVGVGDRDRIQGVVRWFDPNDIREIGAGLFARPQKSPWHFIAEATAATRAHYLAFHTLPGAADAALGVAEIQVGGLDGDSPPPHMDVSQARAWRSAICEDNALVLVQGPPGTGKTAVLEAVVRELCACGKRILVTAPSNAAVDNICRRLADLPILRMGNRPEAIAPDVARESWVKLDENVQRFLAKRNAVSGAIYAGTHVGCLRDNLVREDWQRNGLYDVVVFDEAGMSGMAEFLLCCQLANRAVLFGDHRQLPPFPLPASVHDALADQLGPLPRGVWALAKASALEWLADQRSLPVLLLQHSYRCQNPRLMRFASTLFYNARVRPSNQAEYFRLSYHERMRKYPPASLRFVSTSNSPAARRRETLVLEGKHPGLENPFEAQLVAELFYQACTRHPLDEICIITPYRRQARLIRQTLDWETARQRVGDHSPPREEWDGFLRSRVSTVDSFQGGESDAVIISYVRSNDERRIGFVDDPNRVNVGHTRCRREMTIVGDLDCLVAGARDAIFQRLAHAIRRDGQLVDAETILPVSTKG